MHNYRGRGRDIAIADELNEAIDRMVDKEYLSRNEADKLSNELGIWLSLPDLVDRDPERIKRDIAFRLFRLTKERRRQTQETSGKLKLKGRIA